MTRASTPPVPPIRVENLGFTYPGAARPAVEGLSFTVEAGEIFGFLGPSGAGKSTIQKVLIRLLRGFTGEAEVLGRPLEGWRPDDFSEVGVSFELPNHFLELTARENLAWFAALHGAERTDPPELVLEQVGLLDVIDERVKTFSKGMKNRLNLARSLINRPRLLFLDEPTSGLDPVTARAVRALIAGRRDAGVTVFLTTHDMHTADVLCDRVGFVVEGRLEAVDAPRALRLRHGRREVEVRFGPEGRESRRFPLEGLADDPEFLRVLREERVETLHSQETTLEDVFVAVTGRGLS